MVENESDAKDCKNTGFNDKVRSFCPYVIKSNSKKNRYPEYIRSVKCLCHFCHGIDGSPVKPRMYMCAPKYDFINVLVRGKCKEDGIFEWENQKELVPQICLCETIQNWIAY